MTQDPAQPQVELANADVARAEVVAPVALLEDVNWVIRAGDFWAVGAPPGAGKTDLLSTAAGLQKPIKGVHRLFGTDTSLLNEQELTEKRLRVGMVFTSGRLFPHLTVAENLALPICYHSNWHLERAQDEVRAALELTGLERVAGLRPTQVTRNLHQRIGLARALALQPEVLLVDNPLVSIDPRQSRWWIDFLCKVAEGHPKIGRRLTLVVATDDFRPWMEVAREFAVIRDKKLEIVGGREQVRESTEPSIRELLTHGF